MNNDESNELKEFFDKITKGITTQIYKNIQKNNPEMLEDISESYKEMTLLVRHTEELFISMEKKLKKLINSPSLYEDVYKMRDELIEIKNMLKKKDIY